MVCAYCFWIFRGVQYALDRLWDLCTLWLIPINQAKVSVPRMAANFSRFKCILRLVKLPLVSKQVDLRVMHSSSLHSGDSWKKAASRGPPLYPHPSGLVRAGLPAMPYSVQNGAGEGHESRYAIGRGVTGGLGTPSVYLACVFIPCTDDGFEE
ncbi:unnamed protein product, partial [Dicrocoelium dendriticum]